MFRHTDYTETANRGFNASALVFLSIVSLEKINVFLAAESFAVPTSSSNSDKYLRKVRFGHCIALKMT